MLGFFNIQTLSWEAVIYITAQRAPHHQTPGQGFSNEPPEKFRPKRAHILLCSSSEFVQTRSSSSCLPCRMPGRKPNGKVRASHYTSESGLGWKDLKDCLISTRKAHLNAASHGVQGCSTCQQPLSFNRTFLRQSAGCREPQQHPAYVNKHSALSQAGQCDQRGHLGPPLSAEGTSVTTSWSNRAWARYESKRSQSLILIKAHIRKQETWFKSLILILFYIYTFMFIFVKRDWF